MLQCPSELGCVYFVSFCFPLVVAGPFLNSRNPTIKCLCLDQGSGCSWPEPLLLMVLLLKLFTAKQDIFGFQFFVWLFIFYSSIDLQRSGTRTKHVVFLTRDPWRGCKLLEKWVAFLKWCGCVYLGVDIIMLLWYSSCWVWNASVSKARRRARQKLGEKSEFQCLLVMVHGKVTILCLIFLKHWAYVFFSLWITVCEYISLQHENIRNTWFCA